VSRGQEMNWQEIVAKRLTTYKDVVQLFEPKADFRYKWCNYCIVELRFPTPEEFADFKCNEKRTVKDIRFAKFRANAMYVLRIWDTEEKKWKQTLDHVWRAHRIRDGECTKRKHAIRYEVGKLVFPAGYDVNEHEICAPGIHYFCTLLAAWLYHQNLFTHDGETDYSSATTLLPFYGILDAHFF
jgi:hypothetical protein